MNILAFFKKLEINHENQKKIHAYLILLLNSQRVSFDAKLAYWEVNMWNIQAKHNDSLSSAHNFFLGKIFKKNK